MKKTTNSNVCRQYDAPTCKLVDMFVEQNFLGTISNAVVEEWGDFPE